MGNGFTKTTSYLNVVDDEESRTPEQLKKLEETFDKYDADRQEQFRVIHKYLREDEIQYGKDVENYRRMNNVYVITDRELISRGEQIMIRNSIRWS